MKTKPLYAALFGLLVLAMLLAGWRMFGGSYKYQGSSIDPPVPAADFTLTDQNGQPFRLSDQRGKVALVFFGYTNCTDVCPITLAAYARIRASLGAQADKVSFIFITVDPQRDTAEQMRTELAKFDPAIIGLTGTRLQLEPVWKDYGVFQDPQASNNLAQYEVNHSSTIYAIDTKGNWRLTYPADMDWETITTDVQHLITEAQ